MRRSYRSLFIVMLVASGCGGGDTPELDNEARSAPAEVVAEAPAEPEPTDQEMDLFTVTQAEAGCDVSGPTEVPADQTHDFIVKNPTKSSVELYVSRLTEGRTLQDLLEPQSFPGEYYPKPAWFIYAKSEPAQAFEFSSGRDLADDESAWAFSVEPGPHVVYTWTGGRLWFCGDPFLAI